MKNYEYAKITNGIIDYAPYPLKVNGYDVYGASEEQYASEGYKKVVINSSDDKGSEKEYAFEETKEEIVITYKTVNGNID